LSEAEPAMFNCPECEGRGCELFDEGQFALTRCAYEFVTSEEWEYISFAGLYKKGIPPVSGGALDQIALFNHAARFIWAEQGYWENQILKL